MITLVYSAGGIIVLWALLLVMQSLKPNPAPQRSQPIVTVGMDQDEWLEMMLKDLDAKDRKERFDQ